MNTIKLDRMLFIYALNGKIKCLSVEEIPESQSMMLEAGWKHTATIDPARWIEAMANGHNEPSDMLDEIQFKPNVKVHTPLPATASDETEVKP